MAERNRRRTYGRNRQLQALPFYLRMERGHALALLDAHERDCWVKAAGAAPALLPGTNESRRLLREKLERIQRVRTALDEPTGQ
jgi:hypothetical protein